MENNNILYLEKRGCDFLRDGEEMKKSDLGNFRLFGYIESQKKLVENKSDNIFYIEICTHFFAKHHSPDIPPNSVVTFFEISYENDEAFSFRYLKKQEHFAAYQIREYALINSCNKSDVLNYINAFFNTKYTALEIVDQLPSEIIKKEKENHKKRLIKSKILNLNTKIKKAEELKKISMKAAEKKSDFKKFFEMRIKDFENEIIEHKKNIAELEKKLA